MNKVFLRIISDTFVFWSISNVLDAVDSLSYFSLKEMNLLPVYFFPYFFSPMSASTPDAALNTSKLKREREREKSL